MASKTPKHSEEDNSFVTVSRQIRSASTRSNDSSGSNCGYRSNNTPTNSSSWNRGNSGSVTGNFQSNNSGRGRGNSGLNSDSVKRTPRKEMVEDREKRICKETFNKSSKDFEDRVKDESEREVKMSFRKNVSEITPEKVKEICARVLGVCEKYDYQSLGIKKEELPLKIQATVLGRIVKHIPLMETNFCAYIETLKDLIQEITADQRFKKCTDYGFLNHMCWPELPKDVEKKKQVIKTINLKEYRRAFELLIELYGCDVCAKNVKGESALQAYEKAVKCGSAPLCEEVRKILNGRISNDNLFKMLRNMINVVDPTTAVKFGNTFKLGLMYNIHMLVELFLDNLIKTRPGSETHGLFSQIPALFAVCRTMVDAPIINNEWRTVLEEEHKGASFIDEYTQFIEAMNIAARIKLQDVEDGTKFSEEQLMFFTPTTLPGVIIETSIINNLDLSKVYSDFVSHRLAKIRDSAEKRPLDQNMIISATAHAVNALEKTKKHQLLNILSPKIIGTICELIELKKINVYASTHIESIISNFVGEKLVSRNLLDVCKLACLQQQQPQVTVHVRCGKNKKGNKNKKPHQQGEGEEEQWQVTDIIEGDVLDQEEKNAAAKPNENGDENLSSFIDTKGIQFKTPEFLSTVTEAKLKPDGTWSDAKVDDWVYGQKNFMGKKGTKMTKAFVPTIVFVATNEIITFQTSEEDLTKKLQLLKSVLTDVFGDTTSNLKSFAKSIKADEMGCDALGFDTGFGAEAFKKFMHLYKIEV